MVRKTTNVTQNYILFRKIKTKILLYHWFMWDEVSSSWNQFSFINSYSKIVGIRFEYCCPSPFFRDSCRSIFPMLEYEQSWTMKGDVEVKAWRRIWSASPRHNASAARPFEICFSRRHMIHPLGVMQLCFNELSSCSWISRASVSH